MIMCGRAMLYHPQALVVNHIMYGVAMEFKIGTRVRVSTEHDTLGGRVGAVTVFAIGEDTATDEDCLLVQFEDSMHMVPTRLLRPEECPVTRWLMYTCYGIPSGTKLELLVIDAIPGYAWFLYKGTKYLLPVEWVSNVATHPSIDECPTEASGLTIGQQAWVRDEALCEVYPSIRWALGTVLKFSAAGSHILIHVRTDNGMYLVVPRDQCVGFTH